MPVVDLSYKRLQKLIGKVTKKEISDSLPFLGLDIEPEDGDSVRIEYSPNRPDYSTPGGRDLGDCGRGHSGVSSYLFTGHDKFNPQPTRNPTATRKKKRP